MKKSNIDVKSITMIALLAALACVLSYVDSIVSKVIIPMLPIKIGISNIVVIYAIYRFDFPKALIVVIIKTLLVSLILGSYITFFIGGVGSVLSFFSMYFVRKTFKDKISPVGVSIVGGLFHIFGQILITSIIYQMKDVLIYYGWILVLTSLVTSIIMGLISKKILEYQKFEEVKK